MSNHHSRKADGPLSLIPTPRTQTGKDDPFTEDASQMALVHNMFIRAFNSMYMQAAKVRPEDIVDFLHYCSAWHTALKGHHDAEEEVYFPGLEKALGVKGIMDEEIHEHAAFTQGLCNLKDYIDNCLAAPASYSGTQLISILDSFGGTLATHLANEPPKLASLGQYGDYDPKPLAEQTANHSMKYMHMTDVLPILWYNLDKDFEGGRWADFPNMPGFMKWFMINVMGSWQARWWRFGSSGADGIQRELFCLTDHYSQK
ncbi:hypothetical protein N0V93_006684 [Gnomoniopsis smithogilvyi]|uniref:Hemerythrin-like domain-containing protein n=1 Tax=Gnomoniopsis smithogilvyi TaxID=1191159 RepID=A0A9W8YQ59_9PEZI|nr:hypothetical protein N0V93_006684 [Gnomoniopsis smithogilvyi]